MEKDKHSILWRIMLLESSIHSLWYASLIPAGAESENHITV